MKSEQEKTTGLPCRIHTRLTQEKYNELSQMLEQSQSIRSLSELLRYILDNKPVIVKTYDATMEKVMAELAGIRKELQSIGVNINQITRQFNIYPDFEHRIFLATEAAEIYKKVGVKVEALLSLISKYSERWLPE